MAAVTRGGPWCRLPSLLPHVTRGAIDVTVRHRWGEAAGSWRGRSTAERRANAVAAASPMRQRRGSARPTRKERRRGEGVVKRVSAADEE
uniref:Uncharacterized protein n=1 Tax=Oryza nivara TaxID=4536 RepID=A0A0E0GD14_ORYNI